MIMNPDATGIGRFGKTRRSILRPQLCYRRDHHHGRTQDFGFWTESFFPKTALNKEHKQTNRCSPSCTNQLESTVRLRRSLKGASPLPVVPRSPDLPHPPTASRSPYPETITPPTPTDPGGPGWEG